MSEVAPKLPLPCLHNAVIYRLRFVGGIPQVDRLPEKGDEYSADPQQAQDLRTALRVFIHAFRICHCLDPRDYSNAAELRRDIRLAVEVAIDTVDK